MDIQIENLTLKELVELHKKVGRRMWELGRTELNAKLGEFQIGNPVSSQSEGKTITGTLNQGEPKNLKCQKQYHSQLVSGQEAIISMYFPGR